MGSTRVNLSVPASLVARVRRERPGLNLSEVLRDALGARLAGFCAHDDLECAECSTALDRRSMIDAALSRFFADAMHAIGDLAHRAGTAEGAALVLRRMGDEWGLSETHRRPLPRPTRRARQAALDAKLTELHPAARQRLVERSA